MSLFSLWLFLSFGPCTISTAFAKWCDIVEIRTDKVVHVYEAKTCFKKFNGRWENAKIYKHVENTDLKDASQISEYIHIKYAQAMKKKK